MPYTEQQKQSIYKYRKENPESTKNRLTVYMSPEIKDLLQNLADQTGESKAELIRRLITEEAQRLL